LYRFDFYAFLGWKTEQEHYEVMKVDNYQKFRESFKDYIDATKGVKIHHLELKKVHGDW
jgi:hypothetical protein